MNAHLQTAQKPSSTAASRSARTGDVLRHRSDSSAKTPQSVPSIVHEVLRSPGLPLDERTRAFMEPRFGHDFSGIRVHQDLRAAESARLLSANAYTAGSHVVFGRGRYAPGSTDGNRLLAHELTHAVQQNAGGDVLPLRVGGNDTAAEREACALSAASETAMRPVRQRVVRQIQRDVDEPGRMATTHESLFVSAPGTGGGTRRPWQDASAAGGGTAAAIIRQAKAAVQNLTRTNPGAVGGRIPTQTTEADLDADAVAANQRIRQRFPQITASVSDRQITDAVGVLSPAITSDADFLHQWLANKLIGWTDIELFEIRETDLRFVAMLDALLADADVGGDLHTLATRQSGFQRGEGTSREIAVHHGTSAAQRRLVLVHELVHFYAHATYRAWVNGTTDVRFFNEGFTEWLAQRVMTADERTNRGSYQDRIDAIDQQVAAHVPEDDIARAFFAGEIWRIESRSTIARREFAAASGIREGAATREEASDSSAGPGLTQEVAPGARYRFFNLGHDHADPKPEHVSFFGTLKSRYLDPDSQLRLRFEGHASTPGPLAYNQRLSLQRALAFYQMARDTGVPDARLLDARNPAHFGETSPTLTEEDAETRAFNRRVEMSLSRAAAPTRNPDEPAGG